MTRHTRPLTYRQPASAERERAPVRCAIKGCTFSTKRDPQADATAVVEVWLHHAQTVHGMPVTQGLTSQQGETGPSSTRCASCGATEAACEAKANVCGRGCCTDCDHREG